MPFEKQKQKTERVNSGTQTGTFVSWFLNALKCTPCPSFLLLLLSSTVCCAALWLCKVN